MALCTMMKPEFTMSMSSRKPEAAFAIGGLWKRQPMKRNALVSASDAEKSTRHAMKKYPASTVQLMHVPRFHGASLADDARGRAHCCAGHANKMRKGAWAHTRAVEREADHEVEEDGEDEALDNGERQLHERGRPRVA
jgi:hypothetical protein